ncbi:ImmA/IrrE family metallo-endopeptidase [Alicyclobacillus fodiniaquatilis]|uniref:ImmA/IrrE family metallo-endopeptidase n=1 Tax=Alicyclobacillus fodiniaquatilis TaxID=1661150 RepID=A0ABW4JIF4_9BACL
MNKDVDTIVSWEEGRDVPTYVQLENLAYNVFKRPIAVFYFSKPPHEDKIRKAFRTLPDAEYQSINHNVIKIFRDASVKQITLHELCKNRNPSQYHILKSYKFNNTTSIHKVAEDIRGIIGISLDQQKAFQNEDIAFRIWREAIEKAGIFVFKNAFKEDGISGFCLFDDEFPVIYINNSMPKTRQIFTLFHELAHLMFNIGGIDKLDDGFIVQLSSYEKQIETFCNQFAAEFLIPNADFDRTIINFDNSELSISSLARLYCVSREVISRKMLDRGILSKSRYLELAQKWTDQAAKGKSQSGGGNYYATKITYLGDNYLNLAFGNYYGGTISEYQLADYVDISVANLPKLESKFFGRGR